MKSMKLPIKVEARCPVCAHSSDVRMLDGRIGLYRCTACAHSFSLVPEERQEQYDEGYFLEAHRNWFANPDYRLFDFVYSEVVRLIGQNSCRLLDVGCGRGDFLKYVLMVDPTAKLCGIDLSENTHPNIDFIKGDILLLKIDRRFDAIVSLNTMEHIGAPLVCIHNMKNVLRPGGVLVITTINDSSLIFCLARLLKRVGIASAYNRLYATHNLQYYTVRSLRKLVEDNGFYTIAQIKHNHPLKALDVPSSNVIVGYFYRLTVAVIFGLSVLFRSQILQTITCKIRD